MKKLAGYTKDIKMLQLQVDALKEISREYPSAGLAKLIQDTQRRLEEIEQSRQVAISEYHAKIEKYPALLKEIFELRYIEGLEFKAIARRLNYSERNIYKLHKKLKELLKMWARDRPKGQG